MIENKEFQKILQKYPDDAIIFMGVKYNGLTAFWDVKMEGINFKVTETEIKAIILQNDELSDEYEHLMNGGDVDGQVHSQQ